MNRLVHLVLASVVASVFIVVVSGDATTQKKILNEISDYDDAPVGGLLSEVLGNLVWSARATSYSSLLTLNVANVILLGIIVIALAYYFGDGFARRSYSGVGEINLDGLMSAVTSLTPVVQEALRIYQHVEHSQ